MYVTYIHSSCFVFQIHSKKSLELDLQPSPYMHS